MGFEVDRDGDPARLCDVRQSLDASLYMELLSTRQPLAMGNAEGTLEEEEDEEKREEEEKEKGGKRDGGERLGVTETVGVREKIHKFVVAVVVETNTIYDHLD